MGRKKASKQFVECEDSLVNFELESDALDIFNERICLDSWRLFPDKDVDWLGSFQAKKRERKNNRVEKVDLHGLSFQESSELLEQIVTRWLNSKRRLLVLQIITGKGIHSQDGRGGVLCKHVHSYVLQKFAHIIDEIDESPDRVRVGGLPLRGHFFVTFKK